MDKYKVGVFLGYEVAINIDKWKQEYINDNSNDTLPYGYDRANDNEIYVEYIKLNNYERKILFNKYLGKLYLYFIKLPLALLFKYDIVWTHYDNDALFIAKLRKIPLINKLMSKQIANFVWLIDNSRNFTDKKIIKTAALLDKMEKVIYHSSTETEKFINIFNLNQEKLKCVHFGINFDAYSYDKYMAKPSKIEEKFENFVLSVGTDMHRDMNLLEELAYQMPNFNFVVCSCNPQYLNKKYKSNNVKVLKANLAEMRYLYSKCLCVIIPLKYNEHVSGCTTLLESVAMKKPVIISDTPGITEYIVNNKTGIVVPLKSIKEFKNSIEMVYNNKAYSNRLVENAYEYCKNRFTTDIWAKEHAEITKEILSINKG